MASASQIAHSANIAGEEKEKEGEAEVVSAVAGNGAAPAGWLVLDSVLDRIFKGRGFGTKMRTPITRVMLEIMGVLDVDDTDLMIMQSCVGLTFGLQDECQRMTMEWGMLLIST